MHTSLAEEIGQRIVRGEYPPGSILPNEAKWAETFKVSRSAVREAVKMLGAKSLLASRPKIGSRVEPRERWNLLDRDVIDWSAKAPDNGAFLRMAQEFRHLFEPEAAALAAVRRTPAELADISRSCREMVDAASPELWIKADIRFHLAIIAASGNDLLLPLGAIVEAELRRVFNFLSPDEALRKEAARLYQTIERSIRLRRPNAARRAVQDILTRTDDVIASRLSMTSTA